MKLFKNITLLAILFISVSAATAQDKNVFLDRAFWESDPNVAAVKQKIAEGNDATVFNSNAFDATVYALLEQADDDVIKYLLTLDGNPVDKNTHDSRNYLHWAAYSGKTEVMKTLLAKGASVTALDSHGNTPLTFAANAGQTNTEIYDIFIDNGVDLSKETNENGANALLLVAPSLENENELSYFTENGIDLNSTDNDGNGVFNYAAKKGNIEFLKKLIEKGVDYRTLNANGGNAVLFAAQGARGYSNSIEVYEFLKNIGLKPNVVTKDGYTPLHRLAYSNTDPAIFNFFLSEGADVNQKDANGNTPFLNASSRNTLEMEKLLSNDVKDYNASNENGQTALMLATQRNSPEVVEFLLQKGSKASAEDNSGNTLAYYLANSFDANKPEKFDAKLKLLQTKDLKLNTVQSDGNTLYHLAAKDNDLVLLKRLSDFNIPINATNSEGLTALHIAAMKSTDDQMMRYLIKMGADVSIKTDFEETAYDLASENELLQKQNVPLNFLN